VYSINPDLLAKQTTTRLENERSHPCAGILTTIGKGNYPEPKEEQPSHKDSKRNNSKGAHTLA
jgi:hypothetical protein